MTTTAKERPALTAPASIMERHPNLTAHLISESAGYFHPASAAAAIQAHIEGKPYYCEWYTHAAGFGEENLIRFNRDTIAKAFQFRHIHQGYMRSYVNARQLVQLELARPNAQRLMSW